MKRLTIIFLLFFGSSFKSKAQEVLYSLGMNYSRIDYNIQYNLQDPWYDDVYQVDTMVIARYAFGPSFRLWYEHEMSVKWKAIAGVEASGGLVPGSGSLLNGFLFDIPVYGGADYSLNEKYSLFSTVGFGYTHLVGYSEIRSVFFNLEAGVNIDLGNAGILFKVKYGRLFYQPYSYDFNFEEKDVIRYKAGLLQLGFGFQF